MTLSGDPVSRLRHDLASPLSAILAEAQLLLLQPELAPDVREAVKTMERAALRMRELLRDGPTPGADAG